MSDQGKQLGELVVKLYPLTVGAPGGQQGGSALQLAAGAFRAGRGVVPPIPGVAASANLGATPSGPPAPPEPTGLVVLGQKNGVSVDADPEPAADSFDVYRGPFGGPVALLVNTLTLPYLDGTAVPGTLYDYALAARNAGGSSSVTPSKNGGVADLMVGMLAFWPLDESSGNPADVYDSRDLTNVGACTFTAGKLGNCIVVDASGSQYCTLAAPAVTNEFTWMGWVYFDSLSGNAGIFCLGDSAQFALVRAGNAFNVLFGGFTNFAQDGNIALLIGTGTWAHVAIRFNGNLSGNANRLQLFWNGYQRTFSALVGTFPASISPAGSFYLGKEPAIYGASLGGRLDEVGIWDRALSLDEIREHYLFGRPISFPWPWYDNSTIQLFDDMTDANGTVITAHTPAPTNLLGLSWQGGGDVSGCTINSNELNLVPVAGAASAFLDPGLADFTITYYGRKGTDPTYSAVELVVRYADNNNTLWNHNKFQGDCELLDLTAGVESLVFSGGWAPDNLDHFFAVKVRGNEISGYIDGNIHWRGTTALHLGNTALGMSQYLPGSLAQGAVCRSFELRTGEQFPPYPFGA